MQTVLMMMGFTSKMTRRYPLEGVRCLCFVDAPTTDEACDIEAFEVRRISAFMEISFRMADSAKTIPGNTEDHKVGLGVAGEASRCKAARATICSHGKLQIAKWDGSRTIHTHRDTMVDIRTELADTGMITGDQSFYEHLTNSLPTSLDLFIPSTTTPYTTLFSLRQICQIRNMAQACGC
jgi:hypothetical protein